MSAKTITKVLSRTSEIRVITSDTVPFTTITLINAGYERSITFSSKEMIALKEMLSSSRDTIVDSGELGFSDEADTETTCNTIIEE